MGEADGQVRGDAAHAGDRTGGGDTHPPYPVIPTSARAERHGPAA
jgi:hypothetical protein